MATRDVDVYAQALLPTPRETWSSSSSRNTRSKCQTILAELFTGSPPETMLSSWRVAATSTTHTTLTTSTAWAVHEYRHLISRKHFCTGCWLSHCYQATNVLLIEHWIVRTGFVSARVRIRTAARFEKEPLCEKNKSSWLSRARLTLLDVSFLNLFILRKKLPKCYSFEG